MWNERTSMDYIVYCNVHACLMYKSCYNTQEMSKLGLINKIKEDAWSIPQLDSIAQNK